MPIIIQSFTAICHDCGENITGGGKIEVVDWTFFSGVGAISGDIINNCADHHDTKRVWGLMDLPQHSNFTVFEGGDQVGITSTVSSYSAQVMITITRQSYFDELTREFQTLQKERGF